MSTGNSDFLLKSLVPDHKQTQNAFDLTESTMKPRNISEKHPHLSNLDTEEGKNLRTYYPVIPVHKLFHFVAVTEK